MWFENNSDDQWELIIHKFNLSQNTIGDVQGHEEPGIQQRAILDSASSYIEMPQESFDRFHVYI